MLFLQGDLVESCRNSAGRKIYRCKATISIPPKLLIAALTDTDKVTSWNHTLTEARTLKKISDTVSISYQVVYLITSNVSKTIDLLIAIVL